MRKLVWGCCTFMWRLSYRLFALPPNDEPTVGGFWTRLIAFPLLLGLWPIYWLIIGGPVTLGAALWYIDRLAPEYRLVVGLLMSGLIVTGWILLYNISRPSSHRSRPKSPRLYSLLRWPITLIVKTYQLYVEACNRPLDLDKK